MPARSTRTALLALTVALAAFIAGCGGGELETVNETSGLFHVRVPEKWQELSQAGLLVFYADDELPANEDEAFETLSIGVYTASEASTEAVPGRLKGLIEARAKDRAWEKKSLGKPSDVTVGKRKGTAIDVSGTDEKGREFAGRAILVRTNEQEVLVYAVSPASDWDKYEDDVEQLLTEWYWHGRESTPDTSTAE